MTPANKPKETYRGVTNAGRDLGDGFCGGDIAPFQPYRPPNIAGPTFHVSLGKNGQCDDINSIRKGYAIWFDLKWAAFD
jgi:hypothetical protein